jgi:heme exporter protein A
MELVIENLSARRGARRVLSGLEFRLPGGRAALVRGPNGAGKSTLLRVLAGLLPLKDGDVRLGALSLKDDRSGFQEQVTYAGHLDAVKPALTVAQNLGVWAGLYGANAPRVDDALEYFGLEQIADRPAAQCSAGQKRRLGLARLMVIDRPLWLLDEPTVSLDAHSSGLVADLVNQHCAAGGSAMIATHIDLDLNDPDVLTIDPVGDTPPETEGEDDFLAGSWT